MGSARQGRSRLAAGLTAAVVALSGLVVGSAPAAADTAPPDPADGVVGPAAHRAGQRRGLGPDRGRQHRLRHRPVQPGPPRRLRRRRERDTTLDILAYDITTGALKTGFAPTLNAQGLALAASPDGRTIYVGGDFSQINGQNKYRLAGLDATTGALRTITTGFDSRVRALAVNGNTLYVGGNFGTPATRPAPGWPRST